MNMDNNNRRRAVSTDGFFASGNRPNRRSVHGASRSQAGKRPTGSAPGSVRSLSTFSKSLDGFKSSTQSVIGSTGIRHQSADISMLVSRSRRSSNPSIKRADRSPSASKSMEQRGAGYAADGSADSRKKRSGLFGRSGKQKRIRKQKLTLRTGAIFGSIILLLGCGLAIRAFVLGNSIFKGGGNSAVLNSQDIDPSLLRGEGDGRVNVLVLGKGGPEQSDGPDLTDTIIVASIDPIAKEAALLSVPRDFWIKSPSGGNTKINQVYYDAKQRSLNNFSSSQRDSNEAKDKSEAAGIDAMKQVIGETMGVPIHYYTMIDFAGFRKAIDTVGGIEIDVNEEMAVKEKLWINGHYNLDVGVGRQQFDGQRALAFSRSRKTSARGDYARADRQRAVMVGLKEEVLSSGTLANPVRINQLMSDFSGQLGTDFSVNEMLRLYDLAKDIQSDKIMSVSLEEYIGGDMFDGLSVQVPKAGIFDYSEIHSFVRNTLRDSFLKKEDAKLIVLNGTDTSGLATQKSQDLKSYGYNVVSVGDTPTKGYDKTVLVDLRNGANKYTKSYLEKRLQVDAVSSLPDSSISTEDADFVIIIGSNEAGS